MVWLFISSCTTDCWEHAPPGPFYWGNFEFWLSDLFWILNRKFWHFDNLWSNRWAYSSNYPLGGFSHWEREQNSSPVFTTEYAIFLKIQRDTSLNSTLKSNMICRTQKILFFLWTCNLKLSAPIFYFMKIQRPISKMILAN